MHIRLRAEYILAFDGTDHRLLTGGEVLVQDNRISRVGSPTQHEVDETIELGTSLLLPGLIDLDALADIDHAVFDSCWSAEHARRLNWSQEYFRDGPTDVFDRDDKAFIRWYAIYQLALHGVTTAMPIAAETHSQWAETFDDAMDLANAAHQIGIRAYIGPSYRSGVGVQTREGELTVMFQEPRGAQGLAEALRFAHWVTEQSGNLINAALLPCRIETLTEEVMRATARASEQLDLPVRMHCLQGLFEWTELERRYRASPVQLLERTGLLNKRLLIPHAVYVDSSSHLGHRAEHDVAAIAASGATVVHCPLTSIRYGAALESFGRYRDAGINIALGTDSFPPDLVRGMDYGVNVAKIVDRRMDAAGAGDYLRAATLGGARALRREDLGRIAVGAQADMVAFPLDDIYDGVIEDPVRTLLYNGNARHIRLSMVAGKVIVRHGRVSGVDVEQVRSRAQALFDRMLAAYSGRDYSRRSTDVLFPPSFAPYPTAHRLSPGEPGAAAQA